MSYYLYIVECSDGSLYTGWTTNLTKRLEVHNSGKGSKYTRSRRPVNLVFSAEYPTKSDVSKMEYRVKQLTRKQKIELIYAKNKEKKLNELLANKSQSFKKITHSC
jgi:putative endonuclease